VDLVIADLKLTGVFASRASAAHLRARALPQTAVILLTAFGTAEIEAEALPARRPFLLPQAAAHVHLAGAVRSLGIPVAP